MKRRFSVFFIFLALTFFMSSLFLGVKHKAFANSPINSDIFNLSSKSAILLDANSKTVVYTKNENDKRPIASMCKIMTLLLCLEAIDRGEINENDYITISENASSMGGSQVFLETNAEYKVSDLIKSIVVASANDSCVAMAEKLCGSEELFVSKMNERAKELNMNNTCFVNCTGLPKAGQYSTAKDVSTMFLELLNHNNYYNYSSIWMDKIEHPKGRCTEISNTNKLIRFFEGCDSGKTGYTSEAGHCLVASAKRNDMRLISVVISSPDSKTRFREVSSMFNYGFTNYCNKIIINSSMPINETFTVLKGNKNTVEGIADKPLYLFTKRNEEKPIEIVIKANEKICAPIYKGDEIGEIIVYEKGVQIASVKIVSNEEIQVKSYGNALNDIIDNWAI